MTRFTADLADNYVARDLDGLSAVYHRQSGITHIVSDPVPQILATMAGEAFDVDILLERLSVEYDLPKTQETREALAARLDEMQEVGLVASL